MVDLRITNTMYSSFLVFASIALACLDGLLPDMLYYIAAALSSLTLRNALSLCSFPFLRSFLTAGASFVGPLSSASLMRAMFHVPQRGVARFMLRIRSAPPTTLRSAIQPRDQQCALIAFAKSNLVNEGID